MKTGPSSRRACFIFKIEIAKSLTQHSCHFLPLMVKYCYKKRRKSQPTAKSEARLSPRKALYQQASQDTLNVLSLASTALPPVNGYPRSALSLCYPDRFLLATRCTRCLKLKSFGRKLSPHSRRFSKAIGQSPGFFMELGLCSINLQIGFEECVEKKNRACWRNPYAQGYLVKPFKPKTVVAEPKSPALDVGSVNIQEYAEDNWA